MAMRFSPRKDESDIRKMARIQIFEENSPYPTNVLEFFDERVVERLEKIVEKNDPNIDLIDVYYIIEARIYADQETD